MRIAVLSDIHGNLPALDAVCADMDRRSVDVVVNCGDLLSGPLWPAETAERLMSTDWLTLAGNHERQLLACAVHQAGSPHARYAVCERVDASAGSGWTVLFLSVTYDWHAASAQAARHGAPDWARWLATGRG